MRILLVDLSPAHGAILTSALAAEGHQISTLGGERAVERIGVAGWDAAVLGGADANAVEILCRRLRGASSHVVLIVLAPEVTHERAERWSAAGVDDFELASSSPQGILARIGLAHARRVVLTAAAGAGGEAAAAAAAGPTETGIMSHAAQLEARLRLADRMTSIGTLAAGVAHELNHPLTFMMGNLDLAIREMTEIDRSVVGPALPEANGERRAAPTPAADGEVADRVASVLTALRSSQKGATQMRDIVRSLRTLSYPDDEGRSRVDVRQAMRSALQLAAGTLRARARVIEHHAEVPDVWASESQLVQVFLNLLVNAAQATPEGLPDAEIHVATKLDAPGWVVVEVRDQGKGIAPEERERIFEPFFTTKKPGEGTGLGLSICLRIVASLGGEIQVDGAEGQGSVFRVRLPALEPANARPAPLSDEAALPGAPRRKRILVVDDEPTIGTMIEQLFGDELEIHTEEEAARALERIRSGDRFDVILCDLMMPSMSGSDLHEALVSLVPDQAERMVFTTGGAFTAAARRFLGRVENARIDKPFDLDALAALLARPAGR